MGLRRILAVLAVAGGAACLAFVISAGMDWWALREPSWRPAPVSTGGLVSVASVTGEGADARMALHTEHGDVTFWNGVNLGSSPPGHSPGELALDADTYRRWLEQMAQLHVHVLRVYTIHPPEFYRELRAFNLAHPDHPIYLIQGVYLPDESYLTTQNLWDAGSTTAFSHELADASAAVSGDLSRPTTPGHASGIWDADVSAWLAGWIIGVELDPMAIAASDRKNAGKDPYHGTFFTNSDGASPTEVWLAHRMDELAAHEVDRARSSPIAFVNWPTADPLAHPTEPLESEDLVSVDANHVLPRKAWPGGSFASYHAYPYYPDFLRYEPEYQKYLVDGQPDPYAGYLAALKDHHGQAGLPVMVSEFGVPASIGSAHLGTRGRDQGNHDEREAMAMDAQMLRSFPDIGLAGGLVFLWSDEWFKFTWNTVHRQSVADSERRALWQDPLTNEEWFGILAMPATPLGWRTTYESRDFIRAVAVQTSASFVEMRITFDAAPRDPVRVEFTAAPGVLDVASHAVEYDPSSSTMTAYVRDAVDPIRLDTVSAGDLPAPDADGWSIQRMTLNRALVVDGVRRPPEFQEVGDMTQGSWDATGRNYNSMAMWHRDATTLEFRLPWSMLGMGDPSSHAGVVPDADGLPVGITVPQIPFTIDTGSGPQALGEVRWDPWNAVQYSERLKEGWEQVRAAMVETARARN